MHIGAVRPELMRAISSAIVMYFNYKKNYIDHYVKLGSSRATLVAFRY